MRCVRLTFSILQQEENRVLGDNKLPQLHHVGHSVRHDSPLSPPAVTALPQTLQKDRRRKQVIIGGLTKVTGAHGNKDAMRGGERISVLVSAWNKWEK